MTSKQQPTINPLSCEETTQSVQTLHLCNERKKATGANCKGWYC